MMTYLIIVPFLFKAPCFGRGLSRFSAMLSPWRKFLLWLYNTQHCL